MAEEDLVRRPRTPADIFFEKSKVMSQYLLSFVGFLGGNSAMLSDGTWQWKRVRCTLVQLRCPAIEDLRTHSDVVHGADDELNIRWVRPQVLNRDTQGRQCPV